MAQALSLEVPDERLRSLRTVLAAHAAPEQCGEIKRKRLTKPCAIASDNVANRMRLQHERICQESMGTGKCAWQNPSNRMTELSDRPVGRSESSRIEIEPG